MARIILFLLILFLPRSVSYGQEMRLLQEIFIESEYFFFSEEYADALPGYLQLKEELPNNANIAYRIGVCYLNIPGMKNLATAYLETASKKMSSRHREGKLSQEAAPYDALYQLGLAYRINHQFDEARDAFEKYKKTLLKEDTENKEFIDHEIRVCINARHLIERPVKLVVENTGSVFNDDSDDFNPVISGDGMTFIYMRSMPFYDAVMYSSLIEGKWSVPVNITAELQTDGDIMVSSLSYDGKSLFLSQDDNYNSELLVSTFDGKKWSKAQKLNRNINTKYWESHGSVTEDGRYLIFASDRPGGSGGLDLYMSEYVNGDWGPAVNLGREINTRLNEDRPFLVDKGSVLYFASQGHDNIGGYDIFRSEKQDNGSWGKPRNPGYPFNTTDDDLFFVPEKSGRSGYVSLFRGTDGFGKRDICRIEFK